MKFAHIADCHIGAWRMPELRALTDQAFSKAIARCVEERVDFVLIAGDLFNTALPGVEHVRHVVKHLTVLKTQGIPVYMIAGSHDYSPTGKTMLAVLEEAGLATNVHVVRDNVLVPVRDEKTGVQLTGIPGKAGQLDTQLYKDLTIKEVDGTKIFLFHTTLTELKPPYMNKVASESISLLPPGFDYYAGGHVHIVGSTSVPGYADVVYPGPLFPASFSELEELGNGGFYIVEKTDKGLEKQRISVPLKEVQAIHMDCTDMTPEHITAQLKTELTDVSDKIVLVRLTGRLAQGAAADIPFGKLFSETNAYVCLRNTVALRSPEFIEQELAPQAAEKIEEEVINEHLGQQPLGLSKEEERALFKNLLSALGQTQAEGETKTTYEMRIVDDAKEYLN